MVSVDKAGQTAADAYVGKTQAPSERMGAVTAREATKPEQDEVSISAAARELQDAQKAVQEAPDVREDRVAAIKQQIQEGTYQVPAEALVEKLLSVVGSR